VTKSTGQRKNGAMERTDRLPATKATAARRQPDNEDIDWTSAPKRSEGDRAPVATLDSETLRDGATANLTLDPSQKRQQTFHCLASADGS